MLKSLYISNYALIEQLEVDFDRGLTIITGETGAGKSIIMGALSLILGERANAQSIRDKSAKTVVEATFDIEGFGLRPFFESVDVDYADECILRRELGASGRSRAFVNDTPVQLAILKDLATHLVDIHSQHSNMLLASTAFQLDVLDAFSHNEQLRQQYTTEYQALKSAERELEKMRQQITQAKAEEDYLRFQFSQIYDLKLTSGEDVQLDALQRRLANVNDIKERLWAVQDIIDGEDGSMLQRLKDVIAHFQVLEPMLDEVAGMGDRVNAALIELKDITASVADLQSGLEINPDELERVENRLNDIYTLERKHHVQSVDELLAIQNDYERRLAVIDNSDEQLRELQSMVEAKMQSATALAYELTAKRCEAARRFENELRPMAVALGLNNLTFKVDFNAVPLNARGADAVEFMMSFNKNQSLMPVREAASGGEISRVMLCIKSIVASQMNLPTIIFDEVDTGVSGDIASRIGEMMADIAKRIQVLAITHLPQVASHGNHHYKVYKSDVADATLTSVQKLDDEQHILEIARMLSGRELDQAAIDNAKSLIKQNNQHGS